MATIVSATVTVTDHTKPAQSLYALLTGATVAGYSVVGGFSGDVSGFGMVAYRSVQYVSGGSVYIGDSQIANDGTRQGITLASGALTGWDRDNPVECASLQNLFVRASADSTVFNILVENA